MLFVTLHGGNPESNPHKNNVHIFDKDGTLLTPKALGDAGGVVLDELRGIYFFGKYLYVVNANKDQNSILCYEGAGTKFNFVGKFISKNACKAISHPFDLTFDGTGQSYVSSQDTNVVTRLRVSSDGKTATPAPLAPALPAKGQFYAGTFVASSVGNLGTATTGIPTPAGLEYSGDGQKKHSVRGVVWAGNALYVSDQPACRVKVYDKNGTFLGQSNGVESPVHLVVWKNKLYVSAENQVLAGDLPMPPGNFTLTPIKEIKVKNASGMAFSNAGDFYLASRSDKTILKFDSDFKPVKFDCKLPDSPEFLLHVSR